MKSTIFAAAIATVVAGGLEDSGRIPRGWVLPNATETAIAMAVNAQLEMEHVEGNYQSTIEISRGGLSMSPMTNCNQLCSGLCWATAATMAASAFGPLDGSCSANEFKVVGHYYKTESSSCDSSCSSTCNKGGPAEGIVDGIKFLSGVQYQKGNALSQSDLDEALKNGPVVIAVQWKNTFDKVIGGHAVAMSGVSGGEYMIHDPEGYDLSITYGEVLKYTPSYAKPTKSSGGFTGTWLNTVFTTSTALQESAVVV